MDNASKNRLQPDEQPGKSCHLFPKSFIISELDWRCDRMDRTIKKITGVKVINISEESAEAIEKMVDKAIKEVRGKGLEIVDIQTTGDNLFLILVED
ncbi:hypothetical protein [Nitrospina gracilis]|nr:hypothetical protein [Nitrospina gracilis]